MEETFKQILIVKNIVNNNIVIAKDFYGREVVAIGKGLGFRKHKNEGIYQNEVIKTYVLVDKPDNGVFALFEEVSFEVIEIAQEIIDYAQNQLKGKFNVNLLIALADHINFSVSQYRLGNQSPKLVNEEIKRFYKEEYRVGLWAVERINEKFDIVLFRDEATSIAFHLINAMEEKSNHQTFKIMQAVSDIVKIVENYLGTALDEESMVYSRFIIHLKFFLRNVILNQIENGETSMMFLLDQIKTEYEGVVECMKSISEYIMKNYHYECSDEDCIYLMLHIVRLYERANNKEKE